MKNFICFFLLAVLLQRVSSFSFKVGDGNILGSTLSFFDEPIAPTTETPPPTTTAITSITPPLPSGIYNKCVQVEHKSRCGQKILCPDCSSTPPSEKLATLMAAYKIQGACLVNCQCEAGVQEARKELVEFYKDYIKNEEVKLHMGARITSFDHFHRGIGWNSTYDAPTFIKQIYDIVLNGSVYAPECRSIYQYGFNNGDEQFRNQWNYYYKLAIVKSCEEEYFTASYKDKLGLEVDTKKVFCDSCGQNKTICYDELTKLKDSIIDRVPFHAKLSDALIQEKPKVVSAYNLYPFLNKLPTTTAPTTSAPTSAPTTSAPTTSAPTTSAPTTKAPTTKPRRRLSAAAYEEATVLAENEANERVSQEDDLDSDWMD